MRHLATRYISPFIARIPDLSAEPPRKRATIGLLASVAVHLLLFVLFVIGVWLSPDRPGYEKGEEDKPLEIEIVQPKAPSEPERMMLDEKRNRDLLLSRGMEKSEKKPDNPDFESDQDMVAASEKPADGLLPLPSQDGRTDIPSLDFEHRDVLIGTTENAAEELQHPRKGNEPPRPMYKPLALTQAQLDAANEAPETAALPKVSATPPPKFEDRLKPATPPPLRKVPAPGEGELAITAQKPTTPPPKAEVTKDVVDAPLTRPATAAPQQYAALSTPPPNPGGSFTKRFQQSMEKARIEGSISNRGKPGVNAVGTPMGKYMKGVSSLIGSRWQILVDRDREYLSIGSVRLRFFVRQDGKIENVVVEANDANRNFADVCVQAVRDSKLEPLPAEAVDQLRDGKLEVPFTFTLYSTN